MRTSADLAGPVSVELRTDGVLKFVRDVWSVLEIKMIVMIRAWYWYLINALVFPGIMFYWSRTFANDDPEAIRRMLTGAVVFGLSLMTANSLASQMIQDRFQHRLKLFITMPMSRAAYAGGVMCFASVLSAVTVALLLALAYVANVDISLTWAFLPIVVPAVLSLAGLTIFIASYAPTAEVGQIMAAMLGIVLTMVSPVYFSMEQAPLFSRWVGYVSPMRYAADGIMKSLSGSTDIWTEFALLVGFAVLTLAAGLWKMRWREA